MTLLLPAERESQSRFESNGVLEAYKIPNTTDNLEEAVRSSPE